MRKSIDLIYARKSDQLFFGQLSALKQDVVSVKKVKKFTADFDDTEQTELTRGSSYAVFPELKPTHSAEEDSNTVNPKVTLQALKEGLQNRGISNEAFQNKIISILNQKRVGLQFRFGFLLMNLTDGKFGVSPNTDVDLEVKNNNQVKLIFRAKLKCVTTKDNPEGVETRVEVDITPENVSIDSFKFTKLVDNEETDDFFKYLQDNQASLLQKIIRFIKSFFTVDDDLIVDDEITHTPSL